MLTTMLGWEGLEPDYLDPWDSWRVFKRFLRQPVDCARDAAHFHCGEALGIDGDTRYYFSLSRELSVADGNRNVPVRRVVLELGFNRAAFNGHGPISVDSSDFACLDEFLEYVAGTHHFQDAMAAQPDETDVFAEEL